MHFQPESVAWFKSLAAKHVEVTSGSSEVSYSVDGEGVGIVALDDGKMNAISFAVIAQLEACLDHAANDKGCKSLVIHGNSKVFSSGFDLKTMRGSNKQLMLMLVNLGGLLSYKVFAFPKPVVLGVTGHALALGAILAFAGDTRIGPMEQPGQKQPKVGLNEAAIGMALPDFAFRLARSRVPVRFQTVVLTQGLVTTPRESIEYGFIDYLADSPGFEGVVSACIKEAARLGSYVKQPAYQQLKELERGPVYGPGIEHINKLQNGVLAKL